MKKVHHWAAWMLLPIAILFVFGFLNRESISYFVIKKVAQFYAGRAGIALDIEKVSGRPFSETTLEYLSLRPEEGEVQAYHFQARSIACTYNLLDLKEGYEFFLQGLSCTAQSPEFAQDFSIRMTEGGIASEFNAFLLPAILPSLDVHDGTVIVTNTGWEAAIHEISGGLRSSAAHHELLVKAGIFRFRQQGETRIETGFASSLRYTDKKLSIESFETGGEIRATGFIDLAQTDKGFIGFAAEVAFAESMLNIEGALEKQLVNAQVRINNFDIRELQKRLGAPGWDISGKIRGELDFDYDLESQKGFDSSFSLELPEGQVHGVDVEAVSLSGSFGGGFFNLTAAEARTPGNQVLISDVSIPVQLMQEYDLLAVLGGARAKFEVDIEEYAALEKFLKIEEYLLSEVFRPNVITTSGYLEQGVLHLEESRAETSDSKLFIKEATIPVPAVPEAFESVPIDLTARIESSNMNELKRLPGFSSLSGQAAADISISGTIKEPKAVINLTGEVLRVNEVELGSLAVMGNVQLIQETLGTVTSVQFTVTELTQASNTGLLTLSSPATVSWRQGRLSASAAFQVDEQGQVSISILGVPRTGTAGEIRVSELESAGWPESFIDSGYFFKGADLKALFNGFPNSTELQLTGVIKETGAKGVPFPLSASISMRYSSKGIEISEFTWDSYERNTLAIKGFLPYDPMAEDPFLEGNLALEGHAGFPALEDVAAFLEPWGIGKGSVDLDIDVTGSWDQPQGHILLKVEGLQPPDTLKQYMEPAMDITCDIVAEDDTIFLKTANLDSALYSAQANGSWQHGFSLRKLIQGRKAELRGEVSADADVRLKDLNFLRNKISGLRRIEGDMQGKVHVSGPINDPAVTGSFSLKDGEVSHVFNFPMLSSINLQGELDAHSIIINNLQAEVGGSPVALHGSINWKKESAAASLHVEGKNVLLFRNNDIRMRGDVQLDVSGPLENLLIKGTTGLTGGYYTGNINFLGMLGSSSAPVSEGAGFLFSFPEPPLKNAVLDIKITTIEPFRIRNNLIRGALRPELSLRGTGELPLLIGTIYIDPSRVLLPSGRLQIQSGLLRFLAGEPDRPQLDLVAQSKVLGYDINVITRGPLDDPTITLSSSPALPNDDLMLLLLTGQPPRDDVASGSRSTASTNVMLYLGRDFLTRWLEDESGASDESILDRFELDYGRSVTKRGEQTVEGTFRLSEYTTREGKLYYLSGEKDKYDAYNYGLKLVFRFE